ncbi:hypothetical protein [Enterococcus rivorum]|uniref:LXG domain-containing protein n=1 Tax=Enterococcus rivorum TaxID=762845 RepID=A0A1E5KWS6_9ENTE|nr:hypothetical protein [Enterococcus rivorum]MBP2099117.1 hypothetical protein [Enterococcus rivorum]OEH82268.1 hypothetical protein BCR26_13540 [Enterococcus rivorum]
MGYELKVKTEALMEQKDGLKNGFLSIHNGLVNIEKALTDIESKGYQGMAADSLTELMEVIKSDVIAPTDRYNDLVLSSLNATFETFNQL